VVCWCTKAAISLKRVKIDEKLLWRAYRISPTLFRTVPLRPPLPQDWGFATITQNDIAIISGMGKVMDWKFGRYIHRVHPLKFGRKGSVGVSRNCPAFEYPLIYQETGKATNFKFCTHIHRIDRNKNPLKNSAKVAVGVLRDSRKFSGHPYIGRIARSSLR